MIQTQEYAKQPDARVKMRCSNCHKIHYVDSMLQEEPLFSPHETTVEGLLVCPSCGFRQHCYYLTESLRFRQQRLAELLNTWHMTKKSKDWTAYRKYQSSYQEAFDKTQAKYAEIVKREGSSVIEN